MALHLSTRHARHYLDSKRSRSSRKRNESFCSECFCLLSGHGECFTRSPITRVAAITFRCPYCCRDLRNAIYMNGKNECRRCSGDISRATLVDSYPDVERTIACPSLCSPRSEQNRLRCHYRRANFSKNIRSCRRGSSPSRCGTMDRMLAAAEARITFPVSDSMSSTACFRNGRPIYTPGQNRQRTLSGRRVCSFVTAP